MKLRDYQQRVIDSLYTWWRERPDISDAPICTVPTGGGKSVIIAELVRLLFDTWPEDHPRTLVIVPSKELAEQNGEKLRALLPSRLRLGYYSAAMGRKQADADVIVATIGSIYKDAHLLGNIKCIVIDECHLVNPNGAEAGRFRKLLADLGRLCRFRVVGMTATPFRGNGVWLTDGEDPLFTGIAATVTMQELLDAGFLSPLVRPVDVATRIDTDGIKTTSGDFNLHDLADRVDQYLPAAAAESVRLAADRRKWITFCATVDNARHFVGHLQRLGVPAELVCGDTPKDEREHLVADFRAGRLRCLVTVLALATGFDVPDVDCVIWLRPTKSPVLYVQGAGRGLRIADGKVDCLWIDFSDTTERLGPVDAIRGRGKRTGGSSEAPFRLCDECGERCKPSDTECPSCGYVFPEPPQEERQAVASAAPVMMSQAAPPVTSFDVTRVAYRRHEKAGSPDSLRVDYFAGLNRIASEWVCLSHGGFARAKAEQWWRQRTMRPAPSDTEEALDLIADGCSLAEPSAIHINNGGKYPQIVGFVWAESEEVTA